MKAEIWQTTGRVELVIGKNNEGVFDFFLPVLFKTACKCGVPTNFHSAAGDDAKKSKISLNEKSCC